MTNSTETKSHTPVRAEQPSPGYWRVTFDNPPLNLYEPEMETARRAAANGASMSASTTQSVLGTTTRVCVPLRLKAGAGMTGIELARSDRSRDVRRLLRIYVVDARSISRLRRRWGSRTSLACSDPSTGSAPSSSRPIWTSSEA
jgi:hypothetical protein